MMTNSSNNHLEVGFRHVLDGQANIECNIHVELGIISSCYAPQAFYIAPGAFFRKPVRSGKKDRSGLSKRPQRRRMTMTMRKLNAVALGCLFMTVGLTGCNRPSGPPDPKLKAALVGKWEESGRDRACEFTADGKVTVGCKGSTVMVPYIYEWIGPNRIEWKQNVEGGGFAGARATIAIDDDVLTMDITLLAAHGKERSDGGGVAKFQRIK
jgi:hypothetical protein